MDEYIAIVSVDACHDLWEIGSSYPIIFDADERSICAFHLVGDVKCNRAFGVFRRWI